MSRRWVSAGLTAVTLALLSPAAGLTAGADPASTLWQEEQRAFFQDGPGWLLSEAERRQLLALDEAGRAGFIAAFLARDPLADTPVNELAEGIRRRRLLARSRYATPADVRYQLTFLNGEPAQRLEIDCGSTFHPLEIWTYPPDRYGARRSIEIQAAQEPAVESELVESRKWPRRFATWEEGPKLVLYRPNAAAPFRLWQPFATKRALYNPDMEYLLLQYEELRNLITARRFDLQACQETRQVDEATGVLGLDGFLQGRPTRTAIESFLAPPDDLAAWAREAAATPLPELPPTLEAAPLAVVFPRREGQLMAVRMLVTLPPEVELGRTEEGELELVLEGVFESEGELFGDTRVRYRTKPPPAGTPLALAVDEALRPGQLFVARFRVRDEPGGAVAWVSGGFAVPREPQVVQTGEEAAEPLMLIGEELARQASAGRDSLILAPPLEGQVVLGLWNAQALITGQRIQKVLFLVDGRAQLTRTRPPWTAEVRLATHPTEQVVRAEGYDADGELVAADEVVVNQPRGSFRVRILEPRRGARVAGEVEARVEVVVPDERTVEKVELLVNEELITTLDKPPWLAVVPVPPGEEVAYLAAVAHLDDGRRAEDVRFLNAPRYLEEVEVRLVELYTTVTDRSGRLVRGLTADDFQVLEEGRPQEIVKFELVENLPLTVGITIDTSGSMASSLVEAQRAGRAFLENVVDRRDRCFVVGFSGSPTLLMPPTDDVEACAQGLEGLQAVGWTALHDAVVTSLYYMRELEGQRALVLLSDGDDTASGVAFDDALEYARRSGVVIFPVGLNVSALDLEIRNKLSRLAQETGGRTFFIANADELVGVYEEIESELRSRYLLAFSAQSGVAQGTFRQVEVKVRGRGLSARTARGYYY